MGKGSKPRNNHSAEWFTNYDDIDWESSRKMDKEIESMFYADASVENLPELSSEQSETLMECTRQTLEQSETLMECARQTLEQSETLRSKLYKDT